MAEPEQEKPVNPADVRVAAMNLLARREHSNTELRQKLARRFADESIIEEQLRRLAEENLQSDERFAESFVRQRVLRGHGPLRIAQEARTKGICAADLDRALEAQDVDWREVAREVLEKKFGAARPEDLKAKARRVRFMWYRGFTSEHFNVDDDF